jgi:hypothetical protein
MPQRGAARIVTGVDNHKPLVKVVIIMGTTERAEALFLSDLQPSQHPTPDQIATAIEDALRRWGAAGCAAGTAAEYGEHPDTAPGRMRWALQLLTATAASVLAAA